MGLVCDQVNFAFGAVLTHTGSGIAFKGVPLVQAPGARGMALVSSDPACSISGSAATKLTFDRAPKARESAYRAGASQAAGHALPPLPSTHASRLAGDWAGICCNPARPSASRRHAP
jgi:hypothetical protein